MVVVAVAVAVDFVCTKDSQAARGGNLLTISGKLFSKLIFGELVNFPLCVVTGIFHFRFGGTSNPHEGSGKIPPDSERGGAGAPKGYT